MSDEKRFKAVKDSGERQEFETGSRRDTRKGKGRYDLIPPYFLKRLAVHLENGAEKYGDRNWQLGQPLSRYLDSAMRHLLAVLDKQDDEDHAAAVAWNIMAFMCTKHWIEEDELPFALDDNGYIEPKKLGYTTDVPEAFVHELLASEIRPLLDRVNVTLDNQRRVLRQAGVDPFVCSDMRAVVRPMSEPPSKVQPAESQEGSPPSPSREMGGSE